MSDIRIANRYAKSLLDLSVEKNQLEEVKKDMALIENVINENRDLRLLLKNPIVKGDKKRTILNAVFQSNTSEITSSFLDILAKKGREIYLLLVTETFAQLYNEYKGIIKAEITTTISLNDALRKQVSSIVNEISGKEVELIEKIDPEIIGGFIIKVGDKQIDDTISGRLAGLRRELTENHYIKQI